VQQPRPSGVGQSLVEFLDCHLGRNPMAQRAVEIVGHLILQTVSGIGGSTNSTCIVVQVG